jgi:hypothetical protein
VKFNGIPACKCMSKNAHRAANWPKIIGGGGIAFADASLHPDCRGARSGGDERGEEWDVCVSV